jgi:DNA processing protein
VDAETRALLTLRLVPGLGPRLIRALVDHFGSAHAVLQASEEQLAQVPRLPEKLARALRQALANTIVEQELANLHAAGARVVSWQSPDYPKALRELPDAPPILYLRGELHPEEPCLAVVGSRLCTNYGRRITERLVAGLVRAGYTIVSGLARGIDAIAHQTALHSGGRTVAILAGGLLRVYPPEHRDLAETIAQHGALISEQPLHMPPERTMFPARNRLISGLCQGVVIIEAGDQSGALITARHAAEQGREVFVVPGPVDSPTAGGIVRLLQQGAYPVRDAEEIIAVLRGEAAPSRPSRARAPNPSRSRATGPEHPATWLRTPNTGNSPSTPQRDSSSASADLATWPAASSVEVAHSPASTRQTQPITWPAGTPDYVRQLYAALTDEPQDADALAAQTGLTAQELARALVQLEMSGLVRRLPGNRLMRR